MRLPLPLGRKTAAAKVPLESIERIVNGYLEETPEGKEPTPVYGTPGLVLWCEATGDNVRGILEMTGTIYTVIGTTLYSVNADGAETARGTIPGGDPVSMAGDGTYVVVVTPETGEIYVWNGSALNAVTDPDAPAASSVVWVDGFFVFTEKDTQQFFTCALNDPTDYDALDFASAEWRPDNLVTGFILKRTLYLFGQETIEAQQNVGGADFPFARYEDVFIDAGLVGREAVCATNDTMFWLAHDLTARRMDGLTATRVSNYAVEKAIKTWTMPENTVASAHVWEGHLFIVFRNPDGCVVFDQATNQWHERQSIGSTTWRCRHYAECYGLKLFGSATEGKIYKLDAETFDEDGAVLPFEMITPYAYAAGKRLCITELEVMAQVGVGSLTLDPQIGLERTHDGETWTSRIWRGMGKVGERSRRIVFGPQGQSRGAAFKLTITDPVRRAILGIYVEADAEE